MGGFQLRITIFIVCLISFASLFGSEQKAPGEDPVTTSLTVAGRQVKVSATERPGELQVLTRGGTDSLLVKLPESAGRITELRACSWSFGTLSGVAVGVETESRNSTATHPLRSYYWATMQWPEVSLPGNSGSQHPQNLELRAVSNFLSDVGDFHITEMANPTDDSIYVVLSQVERLVEKGTRALEEDLAGYLFVHACPVADIPGGLYELRAGYKPPP